MIFCDTSSSEWWHLKYIYPIMDVYYKKLNINNGSDKTWITIQIYKQVHRKQIKEENQNIEQKVCGQNTIEIMRMSTIPTIINHA